MDEIKVELRARAVRFESAASLREFRSELADMVTKALDYWQGKGGGAAETTETTMRRMEAALAAPESGLWLLMDEYPTPVGFLFGTADVKRELFRIVLWYIKKSALTEQAQSELFAAVRTYAEAAALKRVGFAVAGEPPLKNPAFLRLMEEFNLRAVLTVLQGEVK